MGLEGIPAGQPRAAGAAGRHTAAPPSARSAVPGGNLRGILSVSMPEELVANHDEQVLFEDIANDIEYALSGIRLMGEHEVTLEELKENEQRFRTIIENAPFGYFRIDREGTIEYVNPEWLQMLGFTSGDVTGDHRQVVGYAAVSIW